MNIWIEVSQTDLQTQQKMILADDKAEIDYFDGITSLSYREKSGARVALQIEKDCLKVKRFAEAISELTFVEKQKTQGKVSSEFGDFFIDLYTHKYLHNDKYIVVEYNVMNGVEVAEYFRFIWKVRERS